MRDLPMARLSENSELGTIFETLHLLYVKRWRFTYRNHAAST